MAELVVVGFDDPNDADRVLTELTRLQDEDLIDLEDAVVAIRGPDGAVRVKQTVNLTGTSVTQSGLWGAMWGYLVGVMFLNPVAGLVVGGALGAGSGALSGRMIDLGINDEFVRSVGDTLRPDTSALFLLVRKSQPEKVLAELSGFKGRILRSTLSPEQEARLRDAVERAQASDANQTGIQAP
ncbi:MAG TPA: DUF1269 domain-containing protein [Microvirga sp.]|jgi:uncharacterized membrane protein|nr:DUF1269 domain-containing protein [Microvirga sp.]